MSVVARFLTPREMAERLGVNVGAVRETLESMAEYPPRGFADSIPIYDEAVFQELRNVLQQEDSKGGDK